MNEINPKIYNELLNEIKSHIHTTSGEARQSVLKEMQKIGVADEHFYEFLGFGREYNERQFKRAAIRKVENFYAKWAECSRSSAVSFSLKFQIKSILLICFCIIAL